MKKGLIPVGPPPKQGKLGEVGFDYEAQGMKDYYQPEPAKPPDYSVKPGGFKTVTRPLPRSVPLKPVRELPFQIQVPKPYNWAIVRVVSVGTTPTSLVQARGNRIVVSLHNLGDFGLWFNFDRNVAVNFGEFIPGSPTAGAKLGGFWSEYLSDDVEIWGVADTGATTINIAVAEFGL